MLRITFLVLLSAILSSSTALAQNGVAFDWAAIDSSGGAVRPQFEAEALIAMSDQIVAATPLQQETLADWPSRSIRDIKISLAETGRTPDDRSSGLSSFGRNGLPIGSTYKVFAWQAPDIKYQPLYFENAPLERYGQTLPAYRQTLRSAWHMTKSFSGLGFQMLETPPRSCDYPLGFCRPGTCVPQTTQRHFFGSLSRH